MKCTYWDTSEVKAIGIKTTEVIWNLIWGRKNNLFLSIRLPPWTRKHLITSMFFCMVHQRKPASPKNLYGSKCYIFFHSWACPPPRLPKNSKCVSSRGSLFCPWWKNPLVVGRRGWWGRWSGWGWIALPSPYSRIVGRLLQPPLRMMRNFQ